MCLGIPGRIEEILGGEGLERRGKVRFSGVVKEVSLACLPEVSVGDYVVVHVGIAISRIDEEEALRTLKLVEELEGGVK